MMYPALGVLVLFGIVKKSSILQIDPMNSATSEDAATSPLWRRVRSRLALVEGAAARVRSRLATLRPRRWAAPPPAAGRAAIAPEDAAADASQDVRCLEGLAMPDDVNMEHDDL